MAQEVSRQLFVPEAWVQFEVSPCGIYGGQSGAWCFMLMHPSITDAIQSLTADSFFNSHT